MGTVCSSSGTFFFFHLHLPQLAPLVHHLHHQQLTALVSTVNFHQAQVSTLADPVEVQSAGGLAMNAGTGGNAGPCR